MMTKEKSIVWHVGGEDIHLRLPILQELQKRGFTVGAVGTAGEERFAESGIPFWRYTLDRWINPMTDRQSIHELHTLFALHRPNIVHAFDTKPAILAMFAAMKANVPGRIRTITGMGYAFSSNSPLAYLLRPVYRSLQRRASQAASVTIFQNTDDRQYFLDHDMVQAEKCQLVLSSGIDVERFCNSVPSAERLNQLRYKLGLIDQPVVIMVARMVRDKGVQEYLHAAKKVVKTYHDAAFLLVGPIASEGRQAVSLEEIQRFAPYVHYLGRREDISALLAISEVVVLPSYYREGVPRVLLEAGALGKPMVTTDMPGCREVVQDGENGLLVPIRNGDALAEAIEKLLENKKERKRMGKKSAELVRQKFALESVCSAYAKIYKQVLAANKC